MSRIHGRSRGRPSRALHVASAVALSLASVSLAAACGLTDLPTPRRTVTVLVDRPATSQRPPAATPSSVGTTGPRDETAGVPRALAVGRQRGAPHSYNEARARIEAASAAASVRSRFQSPTGNIVCTLGGAGGSVVACEVGKGRIPPPLPSICPADGPKDIGRLELRDSGAVPVCNADTIRTSGAPELAYGARTASIDPVGCVSEDFGVTCADATTRHGFFLARDTFVTF